MGSGLPSYSISAISWRSGLRAQSSHYRWWCRTSVLTWTARCVCVSFLGAPHIAVGQKYYSLHCAGEGDQNLRGWRSKNKAAFLCGWPEFHSVSNQMQMTQTFRDEVEDCKQHILRMPCPHPSLLQTQDWNASPPFRADSSYRNRRSLTNQCHPRNELWHCSGWRGRNPHSVCRPSALPDVDTSITPSGGACMR